MKRSAALAVTLLFMQLYGEARTIPSYSMRLLPGIKIQGVASGRVSKTFTKPCVIPKSFSDYVNTRVKRYIPCSAQEYIAYDGTSIHSSVPALKSIADPKKQVSKYGKIVWSVRPDAMYEMTGLTYKGLYHTMYSGNSQYDIDVIISRATTPSPK